VPAPPGYLLFSYILREVQPEVKPEIKPEVKPSDKSVVHMAKEKKESLL